MVSFLMRHETERRKRQRLRLITRLVVVCVFLKNIRVSIGPLKEIKAVRPDFEPLDLHDQ